MFGEMFSHCTNWHVVSSSNPKVYDIMWKLQKIKFNIKSNNLTYLTTKTKHFTLSVLLKSMLPNSESPHIMSRTKLYEFNHSLIKWQFCTSIEIQQRGLGSLILVRDCSWRNMASLKIARTVRLAFTFCKIARTLVLTLNFNKIARTIGIRYSDPSSRTHFLKFDHDITCTDRRQSHWGLGFQSPQHFGNLEGIHTVI